MPGASDKRIILIQLRVRRTHEPELHAILAGLDSGNYSNFVRRALDDATRVGALTSRGFLITQGDRERELMREISELRAELAEARRRAPGDGSDTELVREPQVASSGKPAVTKEEPVANAATRSEERRVGKECRL